MCACVSLIAVCRLSGITLNVQWWQKTMNGWSNERTHSLIYNLHCITPLVMKRYDVMVIIGRHHAMSYLEHVKGCRRADQDAHLKNLLHCLVYVWQWWRCVRFVVLFGSCVCVFLGNLKTIDSLMMLLPSAFEVSLCVCVCAHNECRQGSHHKHPSQ